MSGFLYIYSQFKSLLHSQSVTLHPSLLVKLLPEHGSKSLICGPCICRGSICWLSLCLSGCPVTAGAKNSSWCTGWESQQQRRKLRPGSQIPSVSTAVLVWADALSSPVFSVRRAELYATYYTSQAERRARRPLESRQIRVCLSSKANKRGDVLKYSRSVRIIVII